MPWYDFGDGEQNVLLNSIYYYPMPSYTRPVATNIMSFNLKNPYSNQRRMISLITQYSDLFYMSEKNIYLVTRDWGNNGQ